MNRFARGLSAGVVALSLGVVGLAGCESKPSTPASKSMGDGKMSDGKMSDGKMGDGKMSDGKMGGTMGTGK